MQTYPNPTDARSAAFSVLNALEQSQKTLDHILDEFPEGTISSRDRSLMNAIIFGVLRQKNYTDHIIGQVSKIPIQQIELPILNILRIALFQIHFLSRIPESAAVNTAVEMAKKHSGARVASFVNAVLRTAIRKRKSLHFPDMTRHPVVALSVMKSFPEWLMTRWVKRFGMDETIRLCDVINTVPPMTLRANTLKTEQNLLAEAIQGDVEHIRLCKYSPAGIQCSNLNGPVTGLTGYSDGWFQVQDEASQLTTYLLNPQPGERILDACAGLGGKTGHIAQQMQNQGEIAAFDKDDKKWVRLRREMQRIGVGIVKTGVWDLNEPFKAPYLFDRVLLDAPCSGLGVLRRNPDIKWKMSETQLIGFQEKQVRFLHNVSEIVKPSGILVYSVCSTEPEETEAVAEIFLAQHPNFRIDQSPGDFPEFLAGLMTDKGFLHTYPGHDDMDGFFAVRFKRFESLRL